jgi:hypothetical protein
VSNKAKVLLLVAAGAYSSVAASAVDWASRELSLAPRPLQRTVEAHFTFRNNSAQPVTIRSVQTNCDCLEAGTDKSTYAPGEGGTLVARFTTGDRLGLYERAIDVVTSESPTATRLTVRIEVPTPATVTPLNLLWSIGAARTPQPVEIRVAEGIEIEFTETFATNDSFTARLETITPGRHYRVQVTPAATTEFANAAIRISGRARNGDPVVVSAYANVR